MIDLLCLTPLSAIFWLYHGDQFWWWKKPEYLERTTDHGQARVNFITCGCESSAPFFCNLQSRARTHTILVRAPTTLKSEGEVTSLSGADKREVVRVQGEVKQGQRKA